MYKDYLDIKPEVAEALAAGKPVVALESTIISHGMPYPKNVETAKAVEDVIRKNGVVPATIAIIKGRIKVGLTDEELEYIATTENVAKVSRRDFPMILAAKADGATTVATTMISAEMAGIRLFVTGGIGGVHRGAGETHDISADLEELHSTDVVVVCAGVKSILDIPGTLEYLETVGVPVVGYGTKDFPAFYSVKSGSKLEYAFNTPQEAAAAIKVKYDLGLHGGMVIANPIPKQFEMPFEKMEVIINQALKECEEQHVTGKHITPFMLDRVKQLTDGNSLEANIQLVLNNAEIGSQIAALL